MLRRSNLDNPLLTPDVKNAVHRFTRQAHELAKISLAQSQRQQHSVAVVEAVLLREIDERMR